METSGGYVPPKRPDWCRDMTGWLRVILKQQHGKLNWDYTTFPPYRRPLLPVLTRSTSLGWEKRAVLPVW